MLIIYIISYDLIIIIAFKLKYTLYIIPLIFNINTENDRNFRFTTHLFIESNHPKFTQSFDLHLDHQSKQNDYQLNSVNFPRTSQSIRN